jgi:hypothetical protein
MPSILRRALIGALAASLLAGPARALDPPPADAPPGAAAPAPPPSPPAIEGAMRDLDRHCRDMGGLGVTPREGHVAEGDFNGDGTADFVIDTARVPCQGLDTAFCGSGGCTVLVVVSAGARHRDAFSDSMRGYRILREDGRDVIEAEMHGAACGRAAGAECRKRLDWNGVRFAPRILP